MNVLVLGGGYCNKGNEAMLRVVQRELSLRIEEANIFAILPSSEHDLAYASGIIPIGMTNLHIERFVGQSIALRYAISRFLMQRKSIGQLARSLFSFQNTYTEWQPQVVDNVVGGVDAVIDIHGYAFGDPWSVEGFRAAAQWGKFCRLKKIPYCFLPQTWGPFEKNGYADETVKMLCDSSLFYARETLSQEELAKVLHKPVDNIPMAPDTVLRFGSGPVSLGEDVLRRIGLNRHEKPLIGITPNMRVYERTAGVGVGNEYVRLLARLSEHFIKHIGANVVLIPNEISSWVRYQKGQMRADDRFLCNMVASIVQQPTGCFALRGYHSAEEIHSVISCLDLLVGSRFHTLVFALSAGVPLIALGWAHKYDGLLRQFGLSDYFAHYSQIPERAILELVSRAWEDRHGITKGIKSALPKVQSEVDLVFDDIAKVLIESSSSLGGG